MSKRPLDRVGEGIVRPPRDLEQTLPQQAGRVGEAAFAVVSFRVSGTGPDGRRIEASSDGQHPLRIGRSEHGNQIVLGDERVSRFHCELTARELGVILRDLGSTNGTAVGPLRLHHQEAWLDPKAPLDLTVGGTTLRLSIDSREARVETSQRTRFGALVGASPAMRALFSELERLARSTLPVLLMGEPGVGKELAARSLHDEGPRRGEPFVVIDCSSLTPTLLESELFGHERGAFTGATASRESPFVTARAGTVFLDEIGELPLEAQSKLLRVLQEREVRSVGGRARKIEARVVCATNRDLFREIERGRFREDLFHRLAGIEVEVPPLRDRLGDFDLLVERLVESLRREDPALTDTALPDEVRAQMRAMRWPGNVRELRHALHRYFVVRRIERRVRPEERAPEATAVEGAAPPADALDLAELWSKPWHEARQQLLDRFQARYLEEALARAGNNLSEAAREVGVDRSMFYRAVKPGRGR
jgi:transcriptional regulator with GAF, ATPase, and Fis domain